MAMRFHRLAITILFGALTTTALPGIGPAEAAGKRLADWGVPALSGLLPVSSKRLDKTPDLPGLETVMLIYWVGLQTYAVYSIDSRPYAVVADLDGFQPFDLFLLDRGGRGEFEQLSGNVPFLAPAWVLK